MRSCLCVRVTPLIIERACIFTFIIISRGIIVLSSCLLHTFHPHSFLSHWIVLRIPCLIPSFPGLSSLIITLDVSSCFFFCPSLPDLHSLLPRIPCFLPKKGHILVHHENYHRDRWDGAQALTALPPTTRLVTPFRFMRRRLGWESRKGMNYKESPGWG